MQPKIYKSTYPSFNVPRNISFSQFLYDYNPDDIEPNKIILEEFDDPTKVATYSGIREIAAKGAADLRNVLVLSILHELVHYLGVAGPKFIFVETEFEMKVRDVLQMMGKVKIQPKIVVIGSSVVESQYISNSVHLYDIFNHQHTPLPPLHLSTKDNHKIPVAMIFSSGTSGKPKGVLLSHYNLIAYMLGLRASDPLLYNGFQREVFYASFSHIYGIISVVALTPFLGHYVVIMKRYQFNNYINRCAKIRSTILRLVPTTAMSMTRHPRIQSLDLTSVHTIMCTGAPLQAQLVQKLQSMMNGTCIFQGYGLSEATVSVLKRSWSVEKAGSVGRLAANVQVRIIDDDGIDVQLGGSGELILKSSTLFMGYKDNPEVTTSSFKDDWFCTGDVVRIDFNGFLWLTARKKELIKYKGNQVSPTELEEVLLEHPMVNEAAVCGNFDEALQTQIPVAYVNFHNPKDVKDLEVLLHDIRDFVDMRVSPYKKLRGGVCFLENIPKNASGKVLRRLLPCKVDKERKTNSKGEVSAKL